MNTLPKSKTVGDRAVDGLLAGLTGGTAMAVYLILAGLLGGTGAEEVLSRFGPQTVNPVQGVLTHLAVSGIYGALFGMAAGVGRGRLPGWAGGLVYGVLLFLLAHYVLLPSSVTPLAKTPVIHFFVAHVVYGLVLGVVVPRRQAR